MLHIHVTTVSESTTKPYATTVKSAVETISQRNTHHPTTHTVTASKYAHAYVLDAQRAVT